MVAIVEPLSQEEVTSLAAIHASLYEREGYWPKHLEGSYALAVPASTPSIPSRHRGYARPQLFTS
jgi:hypothetical protein